MFKVRDNSTPKIVLGACWGMRDCSPFLTKRGFIHILAYMVELGATKVGPRPNNNILGQILQTKKSMLALLKRFEILHILSYL